jgi:hypothetical protein
MATFLAACGGGAAGHHPAAAPPGTPKLDASAQQIVDAMKGESSLTYHAIYTATEAGTDYTVEIWQRPPDTREDTTFTVPGSLPTHTEEFKLHGRLTTCVQQGTAAWQCQDEPAGTADPSQGVIGGLGQVLSGRSVSEANRTIGGHPVRCYSSAATGALAAVSVCINDQGIPVAVDSGAKGSGLMLTALDDAVPPNVFALPVKAAPVPEATPIG